VEILAALLAVLALVFFVLRPLASAVAKPGGAPALATASMAGGPAALAAPVDAPETAVSAALNSEAMRISGELRASSVKQVADFVQQHPEESVSILRQWLNNAA